MTDAMRVTTVVVNVAKQGNYFIANSSDVPGLHVWGEGEEQLCSRVVQAITMLYKWNKNLDVKVLPSSDPESFPDMPLKSCSNFVIATEAV